ncbi:MAG: efflux RND transporter periplasmic adaptor subunit [Bacteroidetes bacterium]|nr:MAG: efflux RND transporter periplasmic adaptor subunit [Bacteroidota bacterium]
MLMEKKSKNAARNRNIILGIVILLLLVVVIVPQLRKTHLAEEAPPQYVRSNGYIFIPEDSPLRRRISVGEVETATIRRQVSAPASVEAMPAKRANIFPPAGGRIVQLFVNMGQSVRAGQPLFEINSPEMAEVQTEFISARSALAQAERELRRREELHRRGIAPLRELEEAQTEFEIAQSEMEGAALKLRIMGMDEADIGKALVVRSPINGRVVDLAVAPGEFIAEPEEPLMIIADLSTVWVTANIQEKDIRFVQPGADVVARFSAYPGETWEGTVLFVSDILDQETRTTRVRIELENQDNKLKPGMFASVNFLSQPAPAIVLSPRAVLQRRDYSYVYIETEPFTFEMRRVRTGELIDDQLVILDGLTEGEMVITHNAVMLP